MVFPKILEDSSPVDTTKIHSRVRHILTPPSNQCEASLEGIKVGSLYEIDRSKLPQRCPSQLLHFIRVVMVSVRTELNVTVRYPSTQSLRSYFSNIDRAENLYPDMDEKFVMVPQLAVLALIRRIPTREFVDSRYCKAFWLVQCLGMETLTLPVSICNSCEDFDPKQGTCLLKLQASGLMSWGTQRTVSYVHNDDGQGNNPEYDVVLGSAEWKENIIDYRDMNSKEETGLIALPDGEIKKSMDTWSLSACAGSHNRNTYPVPSVLHDGEREQRKKGYEMANARNSKKRKHERPGHDKEIRTPEQDSEQKTVKCSSSAMKKSAGNRWTSVRYERAVRIMYELLKEKGAVNGNPISRIELRQMARKKIGDTGLLDHILKHMLGHVASDGALRFQRGCNAEGVRLYWLENADLDKIRMEAGVKDPFWFPPPGWKPGEPICIHDCYYAAETKKLKEDLARMGSEMQKLVNEKQEDIVDTLKSFETDKLQLKRVKELYKELLERKANTEKQLSEISEALVRMEALMKEQEASENGRMDS